MTDREFSSSESSNPQEPIRSFDDQRIDLRIDQRDEKKRNEKKRSEENRFGSDASAGSVPPEFAQPIALTGSHQYDAQEKNAATSRTVSRRHPDPAPGVGVMLAKTMWLSAAALIVMGVWYAGPTLVEQYHYAAIKGKTKAEYDIAKVALKDQPLENLSMAYQLVANRIRPSVVHIDTTSTATMSATRGGDVPGSDSSSADGQPSAKDGNVIDPEKFREFHYQSKGQGSGVIMDAAGYILTNEHVVGGANTINVTLFDRRIFVARVVGSDPETDLAVIKIEASDLIAADWGDSDRATFGSLVWAVGSPFGLTQSVTHGIVSANHRRVDNPYQDLIQTDAPINPGNSGGPLVNANGEVIGINTSILGKSYQGVSFAVSSVVARDVYERLRNDGTVQRGFLGVNPGLVTPVMARQFSIPDSDGAFINRVERGSPADRAGISRGDVIVGWNGSPIKSDIELFRHVGMTKVETTAEVRLIRQGIEETTFVTVAPKPPSGFIGRR